MWIMSGSLATFYSMSHVWNAKLQQQMEATVVHQRRYQKAFPCECSKIYWTEREAGASLTETAAGQTREYNMINIYWIHVNKWIWNRKHGNVKRTGKKKQGKANVKLCLHFLFHLRVSPQLSSLGLHIFIFDCTENMLCHEQVSLHINYINQLVQERTAPDM